MKNVRIIIMGAGCIICFALALFITLDAFGAPVEIQTTTTFIDDSPTISVPLTPGGQGTPFPWEATQAPPSTGGQAPQNKPAFDLASQKQFNGAGRNHIGQKWNGCSKNAIVQGGFGANKSRRKCANNSRTVLSSDFAQHLNRKFMPCIHKAAKYAGFEKPARVFLGMGSVRENRRRNTPSGRSSKWSQHAYGRALDIFSFHLYDKNNTRRYVSAHQRDYGGQNRKFYNRFVVCWKKSVRKRCGGGLGAIIHSRADAALTSQGHRFYSNSSHANHIHLEFPNKCRR